MDNEYQKIRRIVLSVIFSLEFCFMVYSGIYYSDMQILIGMPLFVFAAFILGYVIQRNVEIDDLKRYLIFFLVIPLCFPYVIAGSLVFRKLDHMHWEKKDHSVERQALDKGREYMFAGKKVMVFVPHEDDDVLLMGGVFEQYVQNNSEVYVVFEQTGDSGVSKSSFSIGKELGQVRANEAIKVLTSYGIPEKNIIFLGYGSTVSRYHPHLYNLKNDPDQVIKSVSGFDHTYATEDHPAFRDGEKITRNNLFNDYESLILSYKPDVIFAVDYDDHPGHRAVSLMFESVMGKILQQKESYRPVVFKGFCYSTSMFAADDYSSVNPASTTDPYETDHMQENSTYLWKDRVRFPVSVNTLTHYVRSSGTIKRLALYDSQYGDWNPNVKRIVNSDKVFWERRTDSLLYGAKITASSGQYQFLNDFMLFDCDDVIAGKTDPSSPSGVWIPADEDTGKTATVSLNNSSDIGKIVLYDNPGLDDNVLNARIVFDDGSKIETGKLVPNGSATVIPVNKQNVKSFRIVLTDTEGNRAGLSEIEAYATDERPEMGFVKLMSEQGDFVYDYYLNGRDEARFDLYQYNYDVPLDNGYKIETSNPKVTASVSDNRLVVTCPKGQECTIKIASRDGLVSDTVRVSNERLSRLFMLGVRLNEDYNSFLIPFCLMDSVLVLIVLISSLFIPYRPVYQKGKEHT